MSVITEPNTITGKQIGVTFAAEVEGVDFADLTAEVTDRIYDLLLQYGVLFFREAHITEEQQEILARSFGQPAVFPISGITHPEREIPFLSEITDTPDSPPDADGWHTDITWIPNPPKIGILAALDIPESGGDTLWADLYAAYDHLSPVMQEFFEKLTMNHVISDVILNAVVRLGKPEAVSFIKEKFPPVPHPLIRTHPDTDRKALFVAGSFMQSVEGMKDEESEMLISWLMEYINNPNFHVRWQWQAGDLAIWDERCTNHRALSNHYPQYRRMRRCTIEGDAPYLQLGN